MKTYKWFALHWRSGNPEYICGPDIATAFRRAGYSRGALSVLDYYEEVDILPITNRPIYYHNGSSKHEYSKDTLGWRAIVDSLKNKFGKDLSEEELLAHVEKQDNCKIDFQVIRQSMCARLEVKPTSIHIFELKNETVLMKG